MQPAEHFISGLHCDRKTFQVYSLSGPTLVSVLMWVSRKEHSLCKHSLDANHEGVWCPGNQEEARIDSPLPVLQWKCWNWAAVPEFLWGQHSFLQELLYNTVLNSPNLDSMAMTPHFAYYVSTVTPADRQWFALTHSSSFDSLVCRSSGVCRANCTVSDNWAHACS